MGTPLWLLQNQEDGGVRTLLGKEMIKGLEQRKRQAKSQRWRVTDRHVCSNGRKDTQDIKDGCITVPYFSLQAGGLIECECKRKKGTLQAEDVLLFQKLPGLNKCWRHQGVLEALQAKCNHYNHRNILMFLFNLAHLKKDLWKFCALWGKFTLYYTLWNVQNMQTLPFVPLIIKILVVDLIQKINH